MPTEFIHGFLASSADIYPDGRFALLGGGFDAIEVPSFPILVPALAIIARVRVPVEEADRDHLVYGLIRHPEGRVLRRIDATTIRPIGRRGPQIGPLQDGLITNIVINLFNLEFDAGGVYRLDFLEGDHTFGSLEFPVVESAAMPGG